MIAGFGQGSVERCVEVGKIIEFPNCGFKSIFSMNCLECGYRGLFKERLILYDHRYLWIVREIWSALDICLSILTVINVNSPRLTGHFSYMSTFRPCECLNTKEVQCGILEYNIENKLTRMLLCMYFFELTECPNNVRKWCFI